jgi:DNA-binding MarR family transcriptional regulator
MKENSSDAIKLTNVTTYQSGVVQSASYRALNKFTNDILQQHGLTTMQWFIIGTIYDAGTNGIRITDLGKKIDTRLSFLTNTVNLLESKGIVERLSHQTDSRSRMVVVKDSYRETCEEIELDLRSKMRTAIYSKMSPEEFRVYIGVLYKLSELSV